MWSSRQNRIGKDAAQIHRPDDAEAASLANRLGAKHVLVWTLLLNAGVGIAFASYLFTRPFLTGAVSVFLWPQGDMEQYLTGAKFFVYDSWRFPLLVSSYVERSYPQSMAFADFIPLFALVTKLVYKITGYEIPYLAWWYVLVVVAQPISFSLLLWFGGVRNRILLLKGGMLSLLVPTFLYRVEHAALFGHFIILTAMALYFAAVGGGRRNSVWPKWVLVAWPTWLLLSATISLYLLVMAGIFFAAALVESMAWTLADRRTLLFRAFYGACVIYGVAALMFVLGFFVPYSLADPETLARASTNLFSPFVPQLSSLFAGGATIVDATGEQYEGYNYLGAGLLLLMMFALVVADRRPLDLLARHPALGGALAILFLFALSGNAYAGEWSLWSFRLPNFLAAFRSSGRFIWPVTYFGIFFGLYTIDSLKPMWRPFVLVCACLLLQWEDTRLLSDAVWNLGHVTDRPRLRNDPVALRALIAKHRGVHIAPDWACIGNTFANETIQDIGWYAALEHKAINTIYLARPPVDQDCGIRQSTLDAKLQQGYLVVVFYSSENTDTPLSGLECARREKVRVCLASEKVPITEDLAWKLFEPN